MGKRPNNAQADERSIIDQLLDLDDPQMVVDALASHLVKEVESGDRVRGLQAMRLTLATTMAMCGPNVMSGIQARLQSVIDEIHLATAKTGPTVAGTLRERFNAGTAVVAGTDVHAGRSAAGPQGQPDASGPAPSAKRSKRTSG